MLNNMKIMYTTGMAWQLLRTPLSIPPSFLPSSPHRSSPTGRTSGPQPDLPSAPLPPSSPPIISTPLSTCRDPLRHRARDSIDPPLAFYLSQRSLQTNNAHCVIFSSTGITVSSILEEGFDHLALRYSS